MREPLLTMEPIESEEVRYVFGDDGALFALSSGEEVRVFQFRQVGTLCRRDRVVPAPPELLGNRGREHGVEQ